MGGLPILYSFRRCPYAMRARMALQVSGQPVRLREILRRDKPAEMLEASPKATVPVLVVDQERVVDESRAVMDWALERHDPENWRQRHDTILLDDCDGNFKYHLDRYKYASRYEDADADDHRSEAMAFIETLEERLREQAFLSGDTRGYTDIAIFPFIRQFRIADAEWFDTAPIPGVQAWLDGLIHSDLFQSVMAKYPLWKETGEEFPFPLGA